MSRRIAVAANCQTGGITATLRAMLQDDLVNPCWQTTDLDLLRDEVEGADVWVTALTAAATAAMVREFPDVQVIAIPNLYFSAFHPDVIHLPHPSGGSITSPAGDYNSAIVVWGWKNGLTVEQIIARFSRETLLALGYPWQWNAAVARLRLLFEASDLDFTQFFFPLRRGNTFMLGDNHPRIDALVQIARQLGARLGAAPELVQFPWETVIPDALLATGPVWPVYPVVADVLGVRGGLVWRRATGTMLSLEGFVGESLAGYAAIDPDEVKVQAFEDPRWDNVLPHEPGALR